MNATEFERELNKLTEDLAEKYIKLRDLERAGYKDEKLMDMLFYGHVARVEARRIQEEFFPMAENSEEIVMTLLNENFVYEEVDYSNEVDDTSVPNTHVRTLSPTNHSTTTDYEKRCIDSTNCPAAAGRNCPNALHQ